MKISLIALTLMSSFVMPSGVDAKLIQNVFKSKIQEHVKNLNDVYSGTSFTYLDKEDRLLILEDFLRSVDLEYALLPLKAQRIGLDFKRIKEDALNIEDNIPDIVLSKLERKNPEMKEKASFLQAKSNMDFMDRMQIIVARFQDTHFGIQEKIPRPMIYNGLRLFRIQDKIVVGSMENKLLAMSSKVTGNDLLKIKIGDEVLSIDGVLVEDKIKELKQYISASSDGFADSGAVRSLTLRNFKYEKKNYMKITFKNGSSYKVPLFANINLGSTPRLDAMNYFRNFGIPSDSTSIGMNFDKSSRKWVDSALSFEGYSAHKLHLNLKGVVEMFGDNGTPALRTGYYINKGRTYGVLQILTFSTKNVKMGEVTTPFLDAIRNFILEMKETELPLILDLRLNGGGNGNFPAALLSMISEEKAQYASATFGHRMTHYTRQLQEPYLFQQIAAEETSEGISIDDFQEMLTNTIDNRFIYTPMYSHSMITADPKVKGFNNKVVALITPDCISACDMMSMLLKTSKRAVLIGSHTNGTGAGFSSNSELNAKWEDRLKVFSTSIPNILFGYPGEVGIKIFEEDSVSKLCSENLPTVADIPYSTMGIDLQKNNLGWLQKAVEVIESNK